MISWRSNPVRTRLTIWYVTTLAIVLAIYIVTVFFFQYALLTNQIYHDELQDVETVEGLLGFTPDGVLRLDESYHSQPQTHLLADRLMEVRDLNGKVLYRSETLHSMPLGGPPQVGEGETSYNRRVLSLPDGTHALVISHRHPVQGRTVLIRLGYSLAPLWERMLHFSLLLLLAVPATLLLAGFAGYSFAKRALSPLEGMAARTERITASNLHDRLHIENQADELGHMGRVVNQLLDRLELSFNQLQRFTANAAHELRAPLASIRSVGEQALAEQDPRHNHLEAIGSMLEESSRLHQTIEGLLLLARTDSIESAGAAVVFRVPDLVDEVLDLLEALIDERGLRVVEEQREDSDLAISGDRSLVRIALLNVLHNAAKFTALNSKITVTYSNCLRDRIAFLRIAVRDAGRGLQADERALVFERFYMGEAQPPGALRGTGLGLAIAKMAIERSGGQIYFEASVPSGACCVIELPTSGLDG